MTLTPDTGLSRRRTTAVRSIGLLGMIAAVVMILAGAVVWGMVSSQLAAEKITVSEDAAFLAGAPVTGPFTAFAQADVINHHALEASDGKTYAQLDQDDPTRATVMNASFLRASLFTSVVAFGVAALVMGLGVLLGMFSWAIRALVPAPAR
ncbi:hypothetical protein BH09ACT5_BH09ACT5_09740 [soil metagenome]